MLVAGLTGGIGSGKTTVSRMFNDMGIPVLDADREAHDAYRVGTDIHDDIVRNFGESILDEDGSIDRAALGKIVFADMKKKMELENITHPAILKRMTGFIHHCRERGDKVCIIEAALIFEKGKGKLFDRVITVVTDAESQVERLKKRDGIQDSSVAQRIKSQMPLDKKASLSDFVIDNGGTLVETEAQVRELAKTLLEEAFL